ncbi:MAG: sugar ABC transporter substrate-binding protein [Alphaproteobacteria bacterium]|nr:sugar ABC transporter substrate-binding protein [Alphaproteobacteria bacterium]
MKLHRRQMLAASAAALAAPSIARAQAVTLEFPSWQAEEPGNREWLRAVIAEFESKNAGVKVNLFQIPFAQFVNQMTTRFAGNNPPDIVHLPARNFPSFAAQDWLAPLDDRLKGTDIPATWTPLREEMVWDGKTQGVLLMGYGSILYYNEKLLAEAGLGVPTTPEQWLAAIEKTTKRDQGVFGLATTTVEHPQLLVDVGTWVTGLGLDWLEGGRYRFTDPKIVDAFEQYRKSVRFAPPGQSTESTRQIFADGKAAFLRDGPWVFPITQRAPEAVRPHLKMARLPFKFVSGGTSNSFHIAAKTTGRKADLVWEFIRAATSPALQEQFTVLTGSPAPRRDALGAAQAEKLPHLKLVNASAAEARNLFPVVPSVRENYNEFARAVAQAAMRMQSSDTPTATVLADLQRNLERQIPLK